MSIDILERAIVRHVGRYLAHDEPMHILFPTVYECRCGIAILGAHFPHIEIGRPIEEQPHRFPCEDSTGRLGTIMVGSIVGMCNEYLRARVRHPREMSHFERAVALVVNYEANLAKTLCILEGNTNTPIDSVTVEVFLSFYKETEFVSAAISPRPPGPQWNFETDKPEW